MSQNSGNGLDFVDLMKKRAPETLDLFTASTEDEFEKAFDVLLEIAISRLESNSKNFAKLDEEGLSAALVLALNMPGLSATQETNSNGHVDLTIQLEYSSPIRKKLGEAKIYAGPAYHLKGLEQLLERYTTGRESRGLLVVYFKGADIAGLVKKLGKKWTQNFLFNRTELLPTIA